MASASSKYTIFSLSVKRDDEIVVNNCIRKISITDTWQDVALDYLSLKELPTCQCSECAHITCFSSANTTAVFHPEYEDTVETLMAFDKTLNNVKIVLKCDSCPLKLNTEKAKSTGSNSINQTNAFDIIMGSEKVPCKRKLTAHTAKDRLYNDMCEDLENCGILFPKAMHPDTVKKHMDVMVNCLWYLDGNKSKFDVARTASETLNTVSPIPERFCNKFNGYNDWQKKKKAAPTLKSEELKHHSQALFRLLSFNFTAYWGDFKHDLELLAEALSSYSAYLDSKNEQQKMYHSLHHPVRQINQHVTIQCRPATDNRVDKKYTNLDLAISKLDYYQPLFFDEEVHTVEPFQNPAWRYRFIQNVQLTCDIDLLKYDCGGGLGAIVVLWKIPQNRSQNDMLTNTAHMVKKLETRLPEYHTRYMKSMFVKQFGNLGGVKVPQHMLRGIYKELTLDASVDQNPAIDERFRQAILAEDPDLIIDLRHLNSGRPDDTFEVFFSELEKKVEMMKAVDDRRHGECHFSQFISVPDLIKQVEKECPENTKIPSESTVLLAFMPKNTYSNVAKLYKSKINLQFKVQSRQIRLSHQDEHFCAANFKFMREYAVLHRNSCSFFCLDDKSKVDYGEPGAALSSGVRGKKSLVPSTSTLACADHDLGSKGSLTPSVSLEVSIPESADESFYRGQVSVILKDSIFQASSPFRHAIELRDTVVTNNNACNPILMIFTDGGPDHRCTYESVKLSHIVLFKALDLDLLVAGRTAPGNSWVNPAERIMALLNLAYQNCALYREDMNTHLEQVVKSCNSMSEIRSKAEKVPGLKEAWIQSLSKMMTLLNERTCRVSLKDVLFKTHEFASDIAITEFEQQIKRVVDGEIELGKYQKANLKGKKDYHAFLEKHCKSGQYMFQVRKCNDPNCCLPLRSENLPEWVPDPLMSEDGVHYQPFSSCLGKDTTDNDRPSFNNKTLTAVAESSQGCKNTILVGQNVRTVVNCYECNKPRCIYSKKSLSVRESRALKRSLEKQHYTCGALITTEGDPMQGLVFVRLQLSCESHVEFPYYTSKVGRPDLCCHCGNINAVQEKDLLKQYRTVLPTCKEATCMQRGSPKRCPIKS